MDSMISDALAALLADRCGADVVRAIESGGPATELWQAISEAGFADAMVSEAQGGAGLSTEAVAGCWMLAGRHAVPLPLSETMIARAILTEQAITVPDTPIALGIGHPTPAGTLRAAGVSGGRTAGAVLVTAAGDTRLLDTASARSERCAFELDLTLEWPESAWAGAPRLPVSLDTRLAQALVLSLQIAGALDAVFRRSLAWANEREQFGKPIGKFQAIQHQLALMAEESFAATMAARIACLPEPNRAALATASPGLIGVLAGIAPLRVATAKARTSEAALQVAQMAHAVHGAIGFTHEFDLQILTRRLHAWRQTAGSESAWHDQIGRALLSPETTSLDLLRMTTDVVAG
ncbi:MAG: acyl-CoA dehydrogenase [Betaproteobacteria bacterium]|nr:acyl-CoA dehydrogenase [Betaproteobacteria bacterium]